MSYLLLGSKKSQAPGFFNDKVFMLFAPRLISVADNSQTVLILNQYVSRWILGDTLALSSRPMPNTATVDSANVSYRPR